MSGTHAVEEAAELAALRAEVARLRELVETLAGSGASTSPLSGGWRVEGARRNDAWVTLSEVGPEGWPVHRVRRHLRRIDALAGGGILQKLVDSDAGRWMVNRARLAEVLAGRGDAPVRPAAPAKAAPAKAEPAKAEPEGREAPRAARPRTAKARGNESLGALVKAAVRTWNATGRLDS